MFRDIIDRLRTALPLGSTALLSAAAAEHGRSRRRLGYTAAMMVEESRILQVSIFHTLQKNNDAIDFTVLLSQVMMTIADEVDSQLRQAMECYVRSLASIRCRSNASVSLEPHPATRAGHWRARLSSPLVAALIFRFPWLGRSRVAVKSAVVLRSL
jgi:hypothetical protein